MGMNTKESNILHENGNCWVSKTKQGYTVWVCGITHSTSDSVYADLSLAIARCDYLAKRRNLK
jgi:hypothetical protein